MLLSNVHGFVGFNGCVLLFVSFLFYGFVDFDGFITFKNGVVCG
jgi:hypothetical protein